MAAHGHDDTVIEIETKLADAVGPIRPREASLGQSLSVDSLTELGLTVGPEPTQADHTSVEAGEEIPRYVLSPYWAHERYSLNLLEELFDPLSSAGLCGARRRTRCTLPGTRRRRRVRGALALHASWQHRYRHRHRPRETPAGRTWTNPT